MTKDSQWKIFQPQILTRISTETLGKAELFNIHFCMFFFVMDVAIYLFFCALWLVQCSCLHYFHVTDPRQ